MDDDRTALLNAIGKQHGVLLSHHRLMAATDPDLLTAYAAFYFKLTLDQRALSATERELVWTSLTAVTREAFGAIHIRRGTAKGLSDDEIANAVAIAGAVEACPILYGFAAAKWADLEAPEKLERRYLALVERARGSLNAKIADLCAAVCLASNRKSAGMVWHIGRFFDDGGRIDELSEGLSYVLLHCGAPTMIHAVDAWAAAADEKGFPRPYPANGTAG